MIDGFHSFVEGPNWKSDIEVPETFVDGFHGIPIARFLEHLQNMALSVDFVKLDRGTP